MESKGSLLHLQEPAIGPHPEPNESSPHPQAFTLRSIIILSSHLCLDLLSGFFPSGFLTEILYAFFISPMSATCPAHLILLDLTTLAIHGKGYK